MVRKSKEDSDVLTSASSVFAALGGIRKVADITRGTYRQVHNWKAYGKFPPTAYVAISTALALGGRRVSLSLFPGMIAPDKAALSELRASASLAAEQITTKPV